MNKTFLMFACALSISANALADSCDPAKSGAKNTMNVRIDGKVEEMRASIVALSSQNTEVGKQVIASLQKAINDIEANRGRATDGAGEEAYLQCKEKNQPLQNAIDIGVVAATGGLAVLLPEKTWHIDAGDIAKGNVLGGKCSFVRNPLGHGC